ncbi:MAG TPA: hypothetical protein VM597_21235 [Gemmataceae bacterium]|nr:hypothetical protein [Gemmataceae bacterium]
MTSRTTVLARPADFSFASAGQWFAGIADALLNHVRLVVVGEPWRLTEIEFYYRGAGHVDPFAHADPVQVYLGRWYFHRTRGAYRGGSFKGLDLTFGDGEARGGILLRGAEREDGTVIDGPSLFVDALLHSTMTASVRDLDELLGDRLAWDRSSPIYFDPAKADVRPILACARVGLSLRAARPGFTGNAYLTRPYRFLTDPRRTRKGKVQMILGLRREGRTADEIVRATGSPVRSVMAALAEYGAGLREGRFEDYYASELRPRDVARLHGIADRAGDAA